MKNTKMIKFVLEHLKKLSENKEIKGFDEYARDKKLEYPEVYSRLALSYFYLFKLYNDDEWKQRAIKIIEKLISLSKEKNDTIYWGLPFDWKETKKDDGFLITTVFSLQALIKWDNETKGKYTRFIEKTINWIFSLLQYDENLKEKAFYYSPKLKENIYNATSLACGILWEAERYLSEEQKRSLISVVRGLIKAQNKKGFWRYSKLNSTVDLLHQSYTCEGLLMSVPKLKDEIKEKAFESAVKGVEFMDKYMYNSDFENYLYGLFDHVEFNIKVKHFLFRVLKNVDRFKNKFKKVRAWSYAAFLRVHALLEFFKYEGENLISTDEIIERIEKDIFNDEYFKYNKLDNSRFIRQEAHVWFSLIFYLYLKKEWEDNR